MNGVEEVVAIYADGGAEPNPGVGGYAAILTYKGSKKIVSGGEFDTTNNQMELRAVIEALKVLKRPCKVNMFVDSKYVKNGITEWIHNWKNNGWRGSKGEVKNQELWKELDQLCQTHDVQWNWVRAHSGIPLNEECDRLSMNEIIKRHKQRRETG